MSSPKRLGRIVGALLLGQLAGLIVPFILVLPIARGPREYLVNAAGMPGQIKAAVVLLLVNCALTVGISLAAYPLFRKYGERLALLVVAASVVMLTLQAVDGAHILSMLSLSQQFAQASGPADLFQAMAAMLYATRRWSHYAELLAIDCWILVFYCAVYRFGLVPRLLPVFGLVTVLLHFAGVTLAGFIGYPIMTPLGAAMALSHVAVAGWLMVKGFRGPNSQLESSAVPEGPSENSPAASALGRSRK